MTDQDHPSDLEAPVAPSGTITALTAQRRDPKQISVFLDGEFAFGLPLDLVQEGGLRIGDHLDAERSSALLKEGEFVQATTAALNLLASRPRSTREIRDRLRRRDFSPAAIDAAITRLESWHYVDDEAFAEYWVENRATHRPRGRRLLTQELMQKGIDRQAIESAVEAAEIDESADILVLARQKLRSYRRLDKPVAQRRLAGYLGRRGYTFDLIKPLLDCLERTDDGEYILPEED